jgi:hypothetical protein
MKLRKDETGFGEVRIGVDPMQVVSTREALYVSAPVKFWASQTSDAVAATIGKKWVKLPKSTNPCLAALGSFSAVLANYLGYPGVPTKTVGGAVFGVPAVLLSLPPYVAIWVKSTGTPLPVRVDDQDTGTGISLGEWSNDVSVTVPTGSSVVDSSILVKRK